MERIKFFLRMAAILLLILSADALVAGAGLWAGRGGAAGGDGSG